MSSISWIFTHISLSPEKNHKANLYPGLGNCRSLYVSIEEKWTDSSKHIRKEEKREAPKRSYLFSKNSWRCRTYNIFLSFESGAKQRSVTLILKIVERGIYSSFLQATLITDIIPKSAKNMLLVGVKNQPIIKTILRSPTCVSEDKLVVTLKATLHSITKHRMPNWQLLFYIGCLLNIFFNCYSNWKGISLQCCYPWLSSTISLWKNSWCPISNRNSRYSSIQGASVPE